jgi:hypothetical protein
VWQVFFEYECLRKPFGEARQSGVDVFLRDRHQFSIGDDGSRKFPRSLSLPNRREAWRGQQIHQDIADAGGRISPNVILRVGRHGRVDRLR